jgi:hypothetical protein
VNLKSVESTCRIVSALVLTLLDVVIVFWFSCLTVNSAVLLVLRGVTRTSELTLRRPSWPQGDQTVLSTPNWSILR